MIKLGLKQVYLNCYAWFLRNFVYGKELITVSFSSNPFRAFDVIKIGSSGEECLYLGNNKILPLKRTAHEQN